MAHYMKSILDSKLCTDSPDENREVMPSPDQLKNKVLVKVCVQTSREFNDDTLH